MLDFPRKEWEYVSVKNPEGEDDVIPSFMSMSHLLLLRLNVNPLCLLLSCPTLPSFFWYFFILRFSSSSSSRITSQIVALHKSPLFPPFFDSQVSSMVSYFHQTQEMIFK
jgi:hypothetical protein